MWEISEGLKWIVGTITAFVGLLIAGLGLKKVTEITATYVAKKKEDERSQHQSNQGKAIDFDQFAFNKFAERLDGVEKDNKELREELKDVREKLSSQKADNARLDEQNKYLKETNERQQEEIVELRGREVILNQQINSLTNIVIGLQKEIEALKRGENGH